MVRCLIVDDSLQYIKAARGWLERQGIAVVGMASTVAQALQLAEDLRPDVVLVDIDLGVKAASSWPNSSREPVWIRHG
jgi:CheY-like chemotaxis protein